MAWASRIAAQNKANGVSRGLEIINTNSSFEGAKELLRGKEASF